MTRTELARLREVQGLLVSGDRFSEGRGVLMLNSVILAAEREFAAEDAHHDRAEADAYPINSEAA